MGEVDEQREGAGEDEPALEDLEVREADAEDVQGGLRSPSPPSGPTPIPYPNTGG